jgi:hypothetical protein
MLFFGVNAIFYRKSACFASLHEPPIKKGPECCPHSPDPPGTSPVGSPRREADGVPPPLRGLEDSIQVPLDKCKNI